MCCGKVDVHIDVPCPDKRTRRPVKCGRDAVRCTLHYPKYEDIELWQNITRRLPVTQFLCGKCQMLGAWSTTRIVSRWGMPLAELYGKVGAPETS